jgi:acetyl esterase/lipase
MALSQRARSFLATILFSATLQHAQRTTRTPPAENFSRVTGLPYAQGKSAPLLADMYLPNGKGTAPAIIFIHGGGWMAGKRDSPDKTIRPFAEHGYVAMTIDYDLSPGVRFPIALEECKAAVRWLRAHAAEYHVDSNRIAVAGGSAGGELAALVALTGDDPRYEGIGDFRGISSSVKVAVLYSSDLDLTAFPEKVSLSMPTLAAPVRNNRISVCKPLPNTISAENFRRYSSGTAMLMKMFPTHSL